MGVLLPVAAGVVVSWATTDPAQTSVTTQQSTAVPERHTFRLVYKRGDVGPGGGFVFYASRTPFQCGEDMKRLCNYLEVAPFAAEVLRSWSQTSVEPNLAAGTEIGSGHSNTRTIIARGEADPELSAVAYAEAYTLNGFTDWYLPALDEIHELTIARELVGGFTFGVYWTSTERDAGTAWYQNFMNSFQFTAAKSTLYRTRPIRAF